MNIYSTEQFEKATLEQLEKINKGFVKAAYKIKENAQNLFINNGRYNNLTSLKGGIMLGKFENNQVKLHAFGYNDNEQKTYRARFFVGGTKERAYSKAQYKNKLSTAYHKTGRIEPIDTINKATQGGEAILDNYIKQALNNG